MNRLQASSLGQRVARAYGWRQKLPPPQRPWMLYATFLATLAIGCGMLGDPLDPSNRRGMQFELAAADHDLSAMRFAWQQTCDAGFTSADRQDLAIARRMAVTAGYNDIVAQLQAWGVDGGDDSPSPCAADPFDLGTSP